MRLQQNIGMNFLLCIFLQSGYLQARRDVLINIHKYAIFKRGIMKFVLLLMLLLAPLTPAQNTMQNDETFVVEYYYKVKWGHTDEFLRLFKKNHLPVLQEQIKSGRMTRVKVEKPRYHATEDARWDFRVTIVFKSAATAFMPGSIPSAQERISVFGRATIVASSIAV